jgi:hypothetical protein
MEVTTKLAYVAPKVMHSFDTTALLARASAAGSAFFSSAETVAGDRSE